MSLPKPILDRRKSIRLMESLPFKIGHHGYEVEVVTINISYHGVMCHVDKDIPMMTQLDVALSIPTEKHSHKIIHPKGVVVHKEKTPGSDGFLLGIFFSDIKPKDLELLKDFIDKRVGG